VTVNDWKALAGDYEAARSREDSLDRILEWPAQQQLLGDVTGLSILDLGCGSGAKDRWLLGAGAERVVGVDISGLFGPNSDPRLELIQGDLSDLVSVGKIRDQRFDRILFLASLSYSTDQVRTLTAARNMLTDGGQIIVQRSHPIRFAVERSAERGTSLGEEYYSKRTYVYPSGWNESITQSKPTQTISDMLNNFAAAGLRVAEAVEPVLSDEMKAQFPHKQEWLNRYLGVIIFRLIPSP
jgi:SAM-dependent methyltransferase